MIKVTKEQFYKYVMDEQFVVPKDIVIVGTHCFKTEDDIDAIESYFQHRDSYTPIGYSVDIHDYTGDAQAKKIYELSPKACKHIGLDVPDVLTVVLKQDYEGFMASLKNRVLNIYGATPCNEGDAKYWYEIKEFKESHAIKDKHFDVWDGHCPACTRKELMRDLTHGRGDKRNMICDCGAHYWDGKFYTNLEWEKWVNS